MYCNVKKIKLSAVRRKTADINGTCKRGSNVPWIDTASKESLAAL